MRVETIHESGGGEILGVCEEMEKIKTGLIGI